MVTWRLKKGMDRRFRAGHPWVYSNELQESPKGHEPGAPVQLADAGGKFLALGYGNPSSLIAFRSVTRNPEDTDPLSPEGILNRLSKAQALRNQLGFKNLSYRLCYGEADGIPGLIVDHYATAAGSVFVLQAHTAGADRILPHAVAALEKLAGNSNWNKTSIVIRNDVGVRKLEGLTEDQPKVLKTHSGIDLSSAEIRVRGVSAKGEMPFYTDLVNGQKTGFFLDQFGNIQLAAERFGHLQPQKSETFRILDLCCYVGQWGTQLGALFKDKSLQVEVTAVDASATALEFASRNLTRQGLAHKTLKTDLLRGLTALPDKSFDLVISDPPALIKSRKDIPTGTHAYLQLSTQAFRLAKEGAGVVFCSCSALLTEESFATVLTKAAQRNQVSPQWIGHGAQSPDHPMRTEFPEGRYLKGWVGFCSRLG